MFLTFKALHIIMVVSWFAGLFYIVRLMVYLRETQDRAQAERDVLEPQLKMMARRLWFGIAWPAGLATLTFGFAMIHVFWPPPPWLQIKLVLVGILMAYHLACHRLHAQLQRGEAPMSSRGLRIWNEAATVLLVAIVFLVVLKNALSMLWGIVGLIAFSSLLMAGITGYRRLREATD